MKHIKKDDSFIARIRKGKYSLTLSGAEAAGRVAFGGRDFQATEITKKGIKSGKYYFFDATRFIFQRVSQ